MTSARRSRPGLEPWMQFVDALMDERWGPFLAETRGVMTRRSASAR